MYSYALLIACLTRVRVSWHHVWRRNKLFNSTLLQVTQRIFVISRFLCSTGTYEGFREGGAFLCMPTGTQCKSSKSAWKNSQRLLVRKDGVWSKILFLPAAKPSGPRTMRVVVGWGPVWDMLAYINTVSSPNHNLVSLPPNPLLTLAL